MNRVGSSLAVALAAGVFAAGCTAERQAESSSGTGIEVTGLVAPAPIITGPPDSATMAVYATIRNRGAVDDTLLEVESDDAADASLHASMDHGGMVMMMPAEAVPVPRDSTVRLAPGATHIMLESLRRPVAAGDSVRVTLVFRHAGNVHVAAPVVPYDQLERALAATVPR